MYEMVFRVHYQAHRQPHAGRRIRRVQDTGSRPVEARVNVPECVCPKACLPRASLAPCLGGHDKSDALMLCVSQNYSDYLSVVLGFDGFKAHEVIAMLQMSNFSSC